MSEVEHPPITLSNYSGLSLFGFILSLLFAAALGSTYIFSNCAAVLTFQGVIVSDNGCNIESFIIVFIMIGVSFLFLLAYSKQTIVIDFQNLLVKYKDIRLSKCFCGGLEVKPLNGVKRIEAVTTLKSVGGSRQTVDPGEVRDRRQLVEYIHEGIIIFRDDSELKLRKDSKAEVEKWLVSVAKTIRLMRTSGISQVSDIRFRLFGEAIEDPQSIALMSIASDDTIPDSLRMKPPQPFDSVELSSLNNMMPDPAPPVPSIKDPSPYYYDDGYEAPTNDSDDESDAGGGLPGGSKKSKQKGSGKNSNRADNGLGYSFASESSEESGNQPLVSNAGNDPKNTKRKKSGSKSKKGKGSHATSPKDKDNKKGPGPSALPSAYDSRKGAGLGTAPKVGPATKESASNKQATSPKGKGAGPSILPSAFDSRKDGATSGGRKESTGRRGSDGANKKKRKGSRERSKSRGRDSKSNKGSRGGSVVKQSMGAKKVQAQSTKGDKDTTKDKQNKLSKKKQ